MWEDLSGAGPTTIILQARDALTRPSHFQMCHCQCPFPCHSSLAPHACLRTLTRAVLPPPIQTLLQRQVLCQLLGRANPSSTGCLGQGPFGPYLMILKVLCSKRAVGVGRPRAKACFRVSMLRLQSSASFSNLPAREPYSGPWFQRWAGGAHIWQRWAWGHLLAGFSNVAQVSELVRVVQAHLGR